MNAAPPPSPDDRSAQRLTALIDAAPAPGLILTAGQIRANAAAATRLAALDPALGVPRVLPPDHRFARAIAAAVRAARAAGGAVGLSLDGCTFTLTASAGSDGVAVAWLTPDAAADATADPRLKALHAKLQLTGSIGRLGLFERDLETGVGHWDDVCFALFDRDPALGVPPPPSTPDGAALIDPRDRERMRAQVESLFRSPVGREFAVDFRVPRRDGGVRHLEIRGRIEPGPNGTGRRLLGVMIDVTALSSAEIERRESADRLALATSIARIGIWDVELPSGRSYWNEQNLLLAGLPADAPPPGPEQWLQLVHEEDRARMRQAHERLVSGGGSVDDEYRVRRVDGGVVWLRVHAHAERDADGRVVRLLGANLDITAEREAAAERERLLERLQLATSSGSIGIWELDVASGRAMWDDSTCRLLGIGPGPQMRTADDCFALVHPDDRTRFSEALDAALAGRERRYGPIPIRVVAAGGVVHELVTSLYIDRAADGTALRVVGTDVDVTELRTAERRATELAARLSFAQAGAGMGVWDWNISTGETLWDDQMLRIYDEPPGPRSYPMFRSRLHPDDLDRIEREVDRCLRESVPFDQEFRIRTRAGEERVIAARGEVVRDAQGQPVRMIGVNWDVSARRRAERQAREATERLQLATSAAGIGCWEISLVAEEANWDAATYALFAATPADSAPWPLWRRCLHPEDAPVIDRALRVAIDSGVYAVQFRIRRLDGEERWLASRGSIRRDDAGQPLQMIGVSWDVTEARQAEAALRAKETAERANRAKSEFLSRMSHELRTPLNAIIGFTQLLELDAGDPLSATQRERIGLIRNSGWHLLNLINDVLDLSRIESGRASVQMEVVAWHPVLEEAVGMVEPEATARGIVLEVRTQPTLPATLWADRTRLRQVLLNLLSNAVKYNRDHGSVSVAVSERGGLVEFAIRDTGRGLTAEQISRLFQPFDRLGMEATHQPGTGIGLTISQRLTQQMDGALEVHSTPGSGSEFVLRLRASQVQPVPALSATPSAALAADDSMCGTVLYIEDNPANSALVEQFLQFRPGVRLFQAADGATGLLMAGVCQPDLILIDIRLPDMMGDEVLAQLRARPETARIMAVAVSANAMPHDIEEAMASGFADYWTKPLEVARFLRGIDTHLRAAHAASARQAAIAPAGDDGRAAP